MAVQYVDVTSTSDRQTTGLTASGSVTNTVRLHYDDTKSNAEIIEACRRAMEIIREKLLTAT